MKAYHFTKIGVLRNGAPIPEAGTWLKHEGLIAPCDSGLHASAHPFDALQFAPGPILHLVDLDGELVSHGSPIDKWVGRRRKIIASFDATELCRYASRQYALSVAHLWNAPDIVLEFLFTGDPAALDAAWAAAWAAARDAAWDAARNAALDATRAAARDAARDAARAAARAAAQDAAQAAAIEQNRNLFASLVDAEFNQ